MGQRTPFILLDDARREGAVAAHLFENPKETFVAIRGEEVAETLAAADQARRETGGTLAGYISYEAGLALEPKLAGLVNARSGAAGPLIWLGLFDQTLADTAPSPGARDYFMKRAIRIAQSLQLALFGMPGLEAETRA